MASQSQGIQQLLQAEKRAAEKVSEARKREFGIEAAQRGASPGIAARPRGVVGGLGPKNWTRRGRGMVTVGDACVTRSSPDPSLWKSWRSPESCDVG